jgi:hypothetical protein
MIRRRDLLKGFAFSPMAGWLRSWGPLGQAVAVDLDAAPYYRRAFAPLADLIDADKTLVSGWETVPLDRAVDSLLRRFAPALDDLKRGAKIFRCDWAKIVRVCDLGVGDYDAGNLRIGKIALLRARKLAAKGRNAEALDDVFAVACFGRHIGNAGITISRLYQLSMENQAIAALATILPQFGPRELASVGARFANLPSHCSWAETMEREGRFIASTVASDLQTLETPLTLDDLIKNHFDEPDARAVLDSTGGDRDLVVAFIWDVVPYLADLAHVLEHNPETYPRALERFKARPGGIHPLAKSVFEHFDQLRYAAHRTELLWMMVLAARTLILAGLDAFQAIGDPYGDGPFTREDFDGGFELSSALHREGGLPAILRFGGRPV